MSTRRAIWAFEAVQDACLLVRLVWEPLRTENRRGFSTPVFDHLWRVR